MSKALSTTLIVIAFLAVAGGLFFAGMMYSRSFGFRPAAAFGAGPNYAYGPAMMEQYGGYGMMGGTHGYGMMNGRGNRMMGGYPYNNANTAPLTVDQAKAAAQNYLTQLHNADLAIAEVMIFSNNAYVAVKETSTGSGAFELLVDPTSQVAYPEHGPNMMWNVKYAALNHQHMMGGYGNGMMRGYGGMMGNGNSQLPASGNAEVSMSVSAEQAVQYAQKYLDASSAGAVAASDPMQFYGYYTLDYSKDGKVIGMLSVNGYSGQVFPHTWHGAFVQEAEN